MATPRPLRQAVRRGHPSTSAPQATSTPHPGVDSAVRSQCKSLRNTPLTTAIRYQYAVNVKPRQRGPIPITRRGTLRSSTRNSRQNCAHGDSPTGTSGSQTHRKPRTSVSSYGFHKTRTQPLSIPKDGARQLRSAPETTNPADPQTRERNPGAPTAGHAAPTPSPLHDGYPTRELATVCRALDSATTTLATQHTHTSLQLSLPHTAQLRHDATFIPRIPPQSPAAQALPSPTDLNIRNLASSS